MQLMSKNLKIQLEELEEKRLAFKTTKNYKNPHSGQHLWSTITLNKIEASLK